MPPAPGEARRAGDAGASHVTLTALAPDGRPVFRGRVPDQPAAAVASPRRAAAAASSFDAPPGQLQLRMVVQTADGQVMDSSTQELTVPDYTKVQVSFGTPRVFRARTPRELQALLANPDAVPVADRDFSRTERIGHPRRGLRAGRHRADRHRPAAQSQRRRRWPTCRYACRDRRAELDLALAQLAAGDYLVELNAKSEGSSAQEVLAFRLGR